MLAYAVRRILLIVPTVFAIILVNFVIVQAAPGGPVDQLIAQLKGSAGGSLERVSGGGGELTGAGTATSQTRGSRGLDPEFIAELQKLYGFDKPPARAILADAQELRHLQFRQQLLSGPAGDLADRGEAAGVDLAWASGRRCSSI